MKIALALIASLMVAGCSNLAATRPSGLAGEWRYIDPIQSCRYVFEKDGTFSGEVTYRGVRVSQFKGKWAVEGDQLRCEYTADVLRRIPPGTRDTDKLLALTKDHFVIEVADGSKRRYARIR